MLSTGVDVDLMKSILLEQPPVHVFWQEIERLRQTLKAEADIRSLDLPDQLQLQPELQDADEPQQPQVQGRQEMRHNQLAGMAVSSSPDLESLARLAFPGFAETPMATIILSSQTSMSNLNFQVPRTACCWLHGLAEILQSVQQALPALQFRSLGYVTGSLDTENLVQCQKCFAINFLDEDDRFECTVCHGSIDALERLGTACNERQSL